MLADDGAAAQSDRIDVRHAEVGAHAADGHRHAGFAREARLDDAQVRGRPAHVDDDGVVQMAQIACAADGVRRTAGNGQDGVAARVFHGHERAVVLGKIDLRVGDAFLREAVGKALCKTLGDFVERGVEYGGVLALDQAHGADLAGDGDVHVLAHDLAADLRRAALVVGPHGGKDAGDGDGLHLPLQFRKECPRGVLVQRRQLLAVVLKPAADDGALFADKADVLRPVHHRRHAHGRRRADAQKADFGQIFALDDGVGTLRGTQHGLSYLTAVDLRLPKQRLHSADDAFKDVSRGWMLDLGDDAQIFVDEDGVGIGAAYVDAQLIHFPHLP